jgi:PKD domain
MRTLMVGCMLLGFTFLLTPSAKASIYSFTWQCSLLDCSFQANGSVPNVLDYYWTFGDGTDSTSQNPTHHYTPCCGAGFYSPRVDLTYHLSNGNYLSARCYIQYYWSGGVGGDPTSTYYEGFCDGFH